MRLLICSLVLLIGCASVRYVSFIDTKGREHCRDEKTGVFVSMEKCL